VAQRSPYDSDLRRAAAGRAPSGDRFTLISGANEAVTILTDAETHLPLGRSFEWRDPVYKDMNLDAEEYDNYTR